MTEWYFLNKSFRLVKFFLPLDIVNIRLFFGSRFSNQSSRLLVITEMSINTEASNISITCLCRLLIW